MNIFNRPRRRSLGATVTTAAVAVLAFSMSIGPASASQLTNHEWWLGLLRMHDVWHISKGAGVTVAVVGNGVDDRLGDLRGQVLPGIDFTGMSPYGRLDKSDQPDGGGLSDSTQAAAMIAGTGKGYGYLGMAPAAKILPVKIGDSSQPDFDPVKSVNWPGEGVRWAVGHGAKVIDLVGASLGVANTCPRQGDVMGLTKSGDLAAAIAYAYQHDVITVVAAGTGGDGKANGLGSTCPGAIVVTADDLNFDVLNEGPTADFVASGIDVPEFQLNGKVLLTGNASSNDAAAILAGDFALLRSRYPRASARRIVTIAVWHGYHGHAKPATRIDSMRGYGEVAPWTALTRPTAPNASNPIYDQFARELGTPTPSPGHRSSGASDGIERKGATDSAGLLIGIVAAALVAALAVVVLARRSRRQQHG